MAVEILQLTDLHLLADPAAQLLGVPARAAVSDALQFLVEQLEGRRARFERIIITGDLAHDERRETYIELRGLLGDLVHRCLLLPGNHDDRNLLREVFPECVSREGSRLDFVQDVGPWRLVGLDSHVPGEVNGQLDAAQLDWLRGELDGHARRPTLVFLHHPPFAVGVDWLDRLGLRNAQPLLDLLTSQPQVRAVCAGHVHQQFEGQLGTLQLLTTPSTTVQFGTSQGGPKYDPRPPGFRRFRLDATTLETEVVRLPQLRYPPQADSQ